MAGDLITPRPLSQGHLHILRALDRLGAHEADRAMHAGRVAREADRNPETVKHLLNRLYAHELLGRANVPGTAGWAYWLTTEGLAVSRQTAPPQRIEQPQRPPEARTQREGYET